MMNNRGFTLIELLIVIAIIGILAAIAIPAYIGQQRSATRSEAYTNLETLRLLQEDFFANNSVYTATIGAAGADQPGNIALIQAAAALPSFQPGPAANLAFSYQIVADQQITATNPLAFAATATDCFVAIATGNAASRVAGEVFAIDCNNNRNF